MRNILLYLLVYFPTTPRMWCIVSGQVGGNYLDSSGRRRVGCGCDSAVGGFLPQIRGESLVFGETEGEFRRERDLGCSSENGVSIFAVFPTLACQNVTGGWQYVSVC